MDGLDTLLQVALHFVCRNLESFIPSVPDATFTKTRRIRSDATLPIHLTSVSCYGFEEMLINCTHHKYNSYISMDISISCNSKYSSSNGGKSTSNSTNGVESSKDSTSSTKFENMSIASLSIAVIFASAFIVLLVVLIVRQRTKK